MNSTLKHFARTLLPVGAYDRLVKSRDEFERYRNVRRHANRRAQAALIPFHSGLGDSSNLLYGLVRSMKPEVCVEIGSARGNSACAIASALKENGTGKLYAIDPHMPTDWNDEESVDTLSILGRNLKALNLIDEVVIIRSMSADAGRGWVRPIDLIFIDGDHTYEGVKRDWALFVPHIRQFGVVVFHDTTWDLQPVSDWTRSAAMGVPRFVDELRNNGYQLITIDKDCGVTLVQPRIGGVPLQR